MESNKKRTELLILTCIMFGINATMTLYTTDGIAKVMLCAENGNLGEVFSSIMSCLLIVAGEKVSAILMAWINLKYLNCGDLMLRKRIIRNILRRPLRIIRNEDDAYYINILTNDLGMYRTGCLVSYPWVVFFVVYAILSVILLWEVNIVLAIVTVALSGFPLLVDKTLAKTVQKYKDKTSADSQEYINTIKEMVEGIEEIKHNNSVREFEKKAYFSSEKLRLSDSRRSFAEEASKEALFACASIIRLIVLFVGTFLIFRGEIGVANLFAALNYSVALSNSFSNISNYNVQIKSTKKIKERLHKEASREYDDYENENRDTENVDITINNLCFGFGRRKLISNFSYTFEFGRKYAIIGESGNGKTTLINLMLGYYQDYDGEICLAGKNIKSFYESEIYNYISVVAQAGWLMNASLYDNISMLSKTPAEDSDEYVSLLKTVKLDNLAKSVGTNSLGDFGDLISGGERQRICLARSLRRKTPILILDEPTTGLDPENAEIVNSVILGLSGVTCIVITHNYSDELLSKFDGVIRL